MKIFFGILCIATLFLFGATAVAAGPFDGLWFPEGGGALWLEQQGATVVGTLIAVDGLSAEVQILIGNAFGSLFSGRILSQRAFGFAEDADFEIVFLSPFTGRLRTISFFGLLITEELIVKFIF